MRRQTKAKSLRQEILITTGVVLLVGVGIPIFFFTHGSLSRVSSPLSITDTHPTTVAVPFMKLTQGRQSIVAKRVNYFITSSAQLSELWKVVNAIGKPPKVDFKKQAVIAVFAGSESSSSIAVAKIEDTNTRMVSITIEKPDCAAKPLSASNASPYEIVAVPATSLPLAHKDLPMTANCPK